MACAATLYCTAARHSRRRRCGASPAPAGRRLRLHTVRARTFNASLFAASILPLSTAYTVCEGLGFESGVEEVLRSPGLLLALYPAHCCRGSVVVLIPGLRSVKNRPMSQVVNGAVLPFVLIFMLLLDQQERIDGRIRQQTRLFNIIAWATTVIMIVLTAGLRVWAGGGERLGMGSRLAVVSIEIPG